MRRDGKDGVIDTTQARLHLRLGPDTFDSVIASVDISERDSSVQYMIEGYFYTITPGYMIVGVIEGYLYIITFVSIHHRT